MDTLVAVDWIKYAGLLVDLVVLSIIISNAFWGYRRGLVNVICKLITFVVSLLIVFVLYKPVAQSIMNNTQLDEKLSIALQKNLTGKTLENGELLKPSESAVSEGMVELINSFVKDALKESSTNAVKYVGDHLAILMIQAGTFLGLFIISRTALLFVRFAAELIANLPIIKMFNKSGGLIYGVLRGFVTVYVILAVFSVISPIISDFGIIQAIHRSYLAAAMYDNNIIINIVTNH